MREPVASRHSYDRVAMALHWTIAVLILANIAIGLTFPPTLPGQPFSPKPLLPLHVSVGITILLLSIARLLWRLAHRPPAYRHALRPWEIRLAHAGHWAFYTLMIAMPLTGWMTISAHKVQKTMLHVWGIPWPHFPGFTIFPAPLVLRLHDILAPLHITLALWIFGAMLALHVGAVIKHHIDRQPVLDRMLPRF